MSRSASVAPPLLLVSRPCSARARLRAAPIARAVSPNAVRSKTKKHAPSSSTQRRSTMDTASFSGTSASVARPRAMAPSDRSDGSSAPLEPDLGNSRRISSLIAPARA
eukprot:scaffold8514_cov55-Phaeocystis_antarctica.AAC.6